MNNKTIWITGASSGIGKALAIKFAQEGWRVAISARRENLLEEISKNHNNVDYFPLDVTDSEKCKIVFNDVKKKLGDINISVFCTGIHDPKSEKKLNLDKVRKIMEVNFFGTVNSINAVYDYYKDKKSGQISIVSSVAGYSGNRYNIGSATIDGIVYPAKDPSIFEVKFPGNDIKGKVVSLGTGNYAVGGGGSGLGSY